MLTPKAAALKYNTKKDGAPSIAASGKGDIALKIIAKAKEFDVPLFKNDALANSLLSQDIGTQIDPSLFKAVAEVFVWLMKSEEKIEISKY